METEKERRLNEKTCRRQGSLAWQGQAPKSSTQWCTNALSSCSASRSVAEPLLLYRNDEDAFSADLLVSAYMPSPAAGLLKRREQTLSAMSQIQSTCSRRIRDQQQLLRWRFHIYLQIMNARPFACPYIARRDGDAGRPRRRVPRR